MSGYYGPYGYYGYSPYYIGQQLPPQHPQSAVAGPVTKKIVEAFTANYGRAPSTWLEVVDFLLAGAIETAADQIPGWDETKMRQRIALVLKRYA